MAKGRNGNRWFCVKPGKWVKQLKSGATGKLKSLHMYMDMAPHKMAIRFCVAKLNITKIITAAGTSYFLLTLPYFLVCKINEYLPWFEQEVASLNILEAET